MKQTNDEKARIIYDDFSRIPRAIQFVEPIRLAASSEPRSLGGAIGNLALGVVGFGIVFGSLLICAENINRLMNNHKLIASDL